MKQRCPSCRALDTKVTSEGEISCPNPTCAHASPEALRLRADLGGAEVVSKNKALIDDVYAGVYDVTPEERFRRERELPRLALN